LATVGHDKVLGSEGSVGYLSILLGSEPVCCYGTTKLLY
jgi:hypothetical protein